MYLFAERNGSVRRRLDWNCWRKQETTQQFSACSKLTPTGTLTSSKDHSPHPQSTQAPSFASHLQQDHLQPPCSQDSCPAFHLLHRTRDVTYRKLLLIIEFCGINHALEYCCINRSQCYASQLKSHLIIVLRKNTFLSLTIRISSIFVNNPIVYSTIDENY